MAHQTDVMITVLVAVDKPTTIDLVMQVPTKILRKHIVTGSVISLDNISIDQLIFKSNRQTVCDQLLKVLTETQERQFRTQVAQRYKSLNKGPVEQHKLSEGKFRTMKFQIEAETHYHIRVSILHSSIPWLLRHVSFTLNRNHNKLPERTTFEDTYGEQYGSTMVLFRKIILSKAPTSPP